MNKLPRCPRCRCKKEIEETTTLFDKHRWFKCPECGCRYRDIDTYAGQKRKKRWWQSGR